MKYVCFILALFYLVSVPFMPVLAVDEYPSDENPADEPEGPLSVAEDLFPFPDEYDDLDEPEGEGVSDELYAELAQLRANTDYIFLGVIALSGVVLGCFVGITMIRLWGA